MARERRTYKKPPIVEAVVELRFEGGAPWAPDLRERVRTRLSSEYPGPPRSAQQIELQASVTDGGLQTSAHTSVHAVLLPSADGTKLVGIGAGLLSTHVITPYPGWEAFKTRAAAAFDIYVREASPRGVRSIGVRYIDRIALPQDVVSFADYFVGIPPRPESMPPALAGFHVVLQAVEQDGTVVLMTLGSAAPEQDGRPVVLLDVNIVRNFTTPVPNEEWLRHAEELHTRQRDIFEDSITPLTRGLFE